MKARGNNRYTAGLVLLLAALSLGPSSGHAVEISDRLSLAGFYSLDASVSYGGDTALPGSPPGTVLEDGEPSVDYSLIGLQADLSLSDDLRVTAQVVSGRLTGEDYRPSLEWAYATYDFGGDLAVRAGKFKTPLLQGMELRHVAFSRLWVRPLVPAGGAGGFDEYQGVEIIKQGPVGDYNVKVQGAYGVADHRQVAVDDHDIKLVSGRLEREGSWLNLALMQARYDVYTNDLSRLVRRDADMLMGSIEAELWRGNAVLNLGYARSEAEINPDENLAYVSLGYRFDRVTPYLLYQYRRMAFTAPNPPPPRPGAARPPSPPRDGDLSSRALSLGLRYDIDASHAVKAQVERQSASDASYPGRPVDKSTTTVFSITFEGTF